MLLQVAQAANLTFQRYQYENDIKLTLSNELVSVIDVVGK